MLLMGTGFKKRTSAPLKYLSSLAEFKLVADLQRDVPAVLLVQRNGANDETRSSRVKRD
jgi:hypothetical protein